jgi:hypothetical protein
MMALQNIYQKSFEWDVSNVFNPKEETFLYFQSVFLCK